ELAQPVAWRGDRHPAHLGVGVAAAGHPRRGGGQDSPGAGPGREDALAAARLLEVGGTTETPRRRTFGVDPHFETTSSPIEFSEGGLVCRNGGLPKSSSWGRCAACKLESRWSGWLGG